MAIFNHLSFEITYIKHKVGNKEYAAIIYITVLPMSSQNMCKSENHIKILDKSLNESPFEINFSYDIKFVENTNLAVANRWDYLLYNNFNNSTYQWLNLSAVMFLFIIFSFVVGLHFYKLLSKDILRYTQLIDHAQVFVYFDILIFKA